MRLSPTLRLLIGFGAIIAISAISTYFVLEQISDLRRMQAAVLDRNIQDARKLVQIQRAVNALGEAMRTVAIQGGNADVAGFRSEAARLRQDLQSAFGTGNPRAAEALAALDRAAEGMTEGTKANPATRNRGIAELQKQQSALSRSVAQLMEQHTVEEARTAQEINAVYDAAERNRYLFLAFLVVSTAAIAIAVAGYNRRVFAELQTLSDERRTLARGLISVQEEVLRAVSRELHDEFGQILTALNALLRRAGKKHLPEDSLVRADIEEVRAITQETLEKTREFSQALRPAVLDDYGLTKAIERQVAIFEKHYGIPVEFDATGSLEVPPAKGIHIYRIVQEALSNIARHSSATSAIVRLACLPGSISVEIIDNGIGVNGTRAKGLGLIAMRERAELLRGRFAVERGREGGTVVSLRVPLEERDE